MLKKNNYLERLKKVLKKRGEKITDLAERMGVHYPTLWRRFTEENKLTIDFLFEVARYANVSPLYLLGVEEIDYSGMDVIPVLSAKTMACCGAGNGLYGVDFEVTEKIFIDRDIIKCRDDSRKPFAIRVEGDSMESAGFCDGDIAIINPAEEVRSGDSALICYNDTWSIKGVVYMPDGCVELRPANPEYRTLKIEKEYAEDPAWLVIVGKVVSIQPKAKTPRSVI